MASLDVMCAASGPEPVGPSRITGPGRGRRSWAVGSNSGRTLWSGNRPPPSAPPEPSPRSGSSWDTRTPAGHIPAYCRLLLPFIGDSLATSYRSRQTENRLLRHHAFSEVHIVFKFWKMVHFNANLEQNTETRHGFQTVSGPSDEL